MYIYIYIYVCVYIYIYIHNNNNNDNNNDDDDNNSNNNTYYDIHTRNAKLGARQALYVKQHVLHSAHIYSAHTSGQLTEGGGRGDRDRKPGLPGVRIMLCYISWSRLSFQISPDVFLL